MSDTDVVREWLERWRDVDVDMTEALAAFDRIEAENERLREAIHSYEATFQITPSALTETENKGLHAHWHNHAEASRQGAIAASEELAIRVAELKAENEAWRKRADERGNVYRRLQKIEARLRRIEEAAQALLDADAQWVMADCKDLPQARAAVVHAKVALREVLDANGGAPVGRDPAQQTPFQTGSGETTA